MVDARPVSLTATGADVFILRIGKITIALNCLELQALRYEVDHLERRSKHG